MIRTAALALLTVALTLGTLSTEGKHAPRPSPEPQPPAIAVESSPETQELRCTPEHPFWVQGKGFVAAEDLRVGDRGLDAEGNEVVIAGVEIREEQAQHYNLEVEDFHTYFVSETKDDPAVWVHNKCGPAPAAGRGFVTSGRRRPRWANAPETGGLRGHAAKHSDLRPREYYQEAVANMNQGYGVRYHHGGQGKMGYVTRTGPNEFMFTGTSSRGATPTIFTHMRVSQRYLSNIGITLPIGL
tara:strand:- start:6 stop:731 length:726 start_codon:yes stop_codon:yes gene_type:complete